MREYHSGDIRNVAVVGHGGSGKTTLVDALAFVAGSARRRGSVRDGTALTDASPEEAERGYSISLGCAHAEWMGAKVNLIDTPGYADFVGDAVAGLAAVDGAIVVVSAAAGVEAGTERMFREAVRRKDPVLFVVTMLDKENASFDAVYDDIRTRLTPRLVPVEVPLGEGADFRGVMNLFTGKAYRYAAGTRSGEHEEVDVPAEHRAAYDRYRQEMVEAVSATDDALLERYLDGAEIGRDETIAGLKEAMKRGDLYPVFCVGAETTYGVRALLTEIVQLMPSAFEMEELHAFRGAEGTQSVEIHAKDDAPFAAQVFKVTSEPHVGDLLYMRVLSGTARAGQEVYNATRDTVERLSHLAAPLGRDRVELAAVYAGDIACVSKLRNTHTNDTLSTREHPVRLPLVEFPEPLVSFAIRARARGEEEKLQLGLHRLHDEDPTLETHYDPDTRETLLGGMGERHLDVALARLKRRYNVQADLAPPRIAYRETITATADGQGRHKKQSGGRGQFGDCKVRMMPATRGKGYHFVDDIVGGSIPSKFVPAVNRGIQEAAERGVLAGYPMVDFEVSLFDGSYHSVDSNEMSFKMAGILAFKTVAQKCRPVLLEPLDQLEVTTPDAYLGDVLGDLSSRRGHILGTSSDGDGLTTVRAAVPRGELHLYATTLNSLTHGRGLMKRRFHGYEAMPPEAAARVVAESAQSQEQAQA